MAEHPGRFSRRSLLIGAGALAGATLLEACGGDGDGSDDASSSKDSSTTTSPERELTLVPFFDGPVFTAGRPLRAVFGIADADGLLPVDDTPDEVSITLRAASGGDVIPPMTVRRHSRGLQLPYFPVTTTLPAVGTYRVTMTLPDATELRAPLQVHPPEAVTVLQPGARLPALQLPTTADALGVTPICTGTPACSLHDVTGTTALAEGRPIALLVATPAFCQVSLCGPVLDLLLQAVSAHPSVRFLHAEVYADPATSLERYAPAMAQLGLQSEPCLFLVGADGVVAQRLDTIYDLDELQTALEGLV